MLPKNNRLLTKQFDMAWKRGTSACGAFVCVRILTDTNDLRYACIAPKKYARRAIDRNHIRRRLYGALTTCLLQGNAHVIISPKSDIMTVPFDALCHDIAYTLAKARQRAQKK